MTAVNAIKTGRKYAGFYATIDPGQCTPLSRVGLSQDPCAPPEVWLRERGPNGTPKRRRMNVASYRGLRLILQHAAMPPLPKAEAARVKEAYRWLRSVEHWYEHNTMSHTQTRSDAARAARTRGKQEPTNG